VRKKWAKLLHPPFSAGRCRGREGEEQHEARRKAVFGQKQLKLNSGVPCVTWIRAFLGRALTFFDANERSTNKYCNWPAIFKFNHAFFITI